jgi:hypothetical protein
MAVYKVPQDVEADDKLIGPFSFRQFIYLLIVAGAIALGWGLSRLFVPLAIIPLPIVLFFGLLALPLRKDQPMEIYMAAIVSFYLKPRKRLWVPDGVQSMVEITAPKSIEIQRTKDLSQLEAEQRLSYLADIVDTGGWAVRGVVNPEASNAMQTDAYFEAQQTVDILDDNGGIAQSFDSMISQADVKRRQEIMDRINRQATAPTVDIIPVLPPASAPVAPVVAPPAPVADPYASLQPVAAPVVTQTAPDPQVSFNPYPTSMHQSVVRPLSEQPVATQAPPVAVPPAPNTSEKPVSPDIINLANNADLSIETIAHEAKRIQQKEEQLKDDGEVVISLR